VPNLVISDGGVFSLAGAANPTLTIFALVLRQADYITRELAAARL
jgi:choline dehydrogenase-like flavoprotein